MNLLFSTTFLIAVSFQYCTSILRSFELRLAAYWAPHNACMDLSQLVKIMQRRKPG